MAEVTDCSVCAEKFTSSVRTKICCGYCSYNACKTCVTRYLLSQVLDAHCMNCRMGWNREFLDLNLSKAFVKGLWREHKKKMYLNREKALLSNFQKYAAAKKKMQEIGPKLSEALKNHTAIDNEKHKCHATISERKQKIARDNIQPNEEFYVNHLSYISKLSDIYKEETENYIIYQRLQMRFNRYNNIYNDNDTTVKEKKEFIMKCVKEGCRGFLSQSYKCELCSTYVCKDCMLIKAEKNDETHVCKKEDVDTVSMIRKETRPCPKCGIRISKIDGCDQMWCTADGCGTAFSWISGKIINGTIHNPHYYEWVRRNNNGVVPRNPGDIPCGGFPDYHSIGTPLRALGLNVSYTATTPLNKQVSLIYAIHRCFMDIQGFRIPMYTTIRDNIMFKELHVNFLLENLTEEKWIQSIFMKELNMEKKNAILAVLQTFLAAGQDLFREIVTQLNELVAKKTPNKAYIVTIDEFKNVIEVLDQFEELRNYINQSLIKTGEDLSTPVPQISQPWICESAASTERIKEKAKESKEKK
uniref:RING-type domain-containing protein n=1 Tax=viral metagenome TaxID=1070528 RepID=A0A6C0D553_9ZZZZ